MCATECHRPRWVLPPVQAVGTLTTHSTFFHGSYQHTCILTAQTTHKNNSSAFCSSVHFQKHAQLFVITPSQPAIDVAACSSQKFAFFSKSCNL